MSKKITNTAEEDIGLHWLGGGNPGAIEAQEARGQRELVKSSQVPRKCNYPHNMDVKKQYEELGFKNVIPTEGDDLFFQADLPEGWKLEALDHDMWNRLVDDKGRERASIFYKAAFYDRDSFINFNHRYNSVSEYAEKEEGDKYHPKFYCVKDNGTGEILFKTELSKEYYDEKLSNQADKWLKKNFPDHEKITAYWD